MTEPLPGGTVGDPATDQNLRKLASKYPLQGSDLGDGMIADRHVNASAAIKLSKLDARSLSAAASGALTLGAEADVAGATVTTPNDGVTRTWLVVGTFAFAVTTAPELCTGFLNVDGSNQAAQANFQAATATGRATCVQSWIVTVGPNKVLKLRASKTLAGAASAAQTHTTINAVAIA